MKRRQRDWADSPYSRLYHSLISDPKFHEIYDDDAALAAYARMLMAHDQTYPQPAQVPAGCRPSAVRLLASKNVIKMVSKTRYIVTALQAEREARSEQARKAAKARWDADSMHQHSVSNPDGMLERERVREELRIPVKVTRRNGTTKSDSLRARGPQKISDTAALRNIEMMVAQSAKKS